jgi:hypothetical protein
MRALFKRSALPDVSIITYLTNVDKIVYFMHPMQRVARLFSP